MLILSYAAFGQQIKNKNVELDDFITLLKASGYELFSYDITEMLNERYDITFVKKEFEAGKEIETSDLNEYPLPNKRLLTDLPETSRQKALEAGVSIIDPETQAIAHAEKISFGFYPYDTWVSESINDSTKFLQISVPNFGSTRDELKLRGLSTKDSDKKYYSYHTRPFKITAFEEDQFIPLVLFGSSWYDERFDYYRFCGEAEIDPDMSSEILKNVPHYYVIGVKFVKTK
jgi:hypothetical protein